jgi:hypothetical protein
LNSSPHFSGLLAALIFKNISTHNNALYDEL